MSERSIFSAALDISDPADRAAYLDRACAGDPALRRHIEELLAAQSGLGSFLAHPPVAAGVAADYEAPAEGPGARVGPYKLLQQIGEGGMGAVFMAEQEEPVRRKVALKIIKPGMDSKQVVARFEAERQALALMDHSNIARVLDGGATSGGQPYFVMELVKGTPITRYCDEHRLTLRERLELFVQVCHAVQHAHQKGVIHRDLKPSNVLVAPYDGRPVVKVIDFGVAKATGQRLTERTLFTGFGAVIGTPEYMSPEQAELNNQDIDTRSDVYSLGVLLYELLTGATPLDRARLGRVAFPELLRVIREEEPPKPSTRLSESKGSLPTVSAQRRMEPGKLARLVRGELDWIVMKALEKDRSRRYETANGLAMDVQRYLADEPVQACPPSAGYRLRKLARRHRAALTVAALALLFLVSLGGGAGWIVRDQSARRAETAAHIGEALEEAARLRAQKNWQGARAATLRADVLLSADRSHPDLRQRLDDLVKDLDMVDRLERVREAPTAVRGEGWDYAAADDGYETAFRAYGIDLWASPPAVAAERIKSSAIADELLAALDDWLWFIPKGSARHEAVREVAGLADRDPWRARLRDPAVQRNRQALEELASRAELADLPPVTVVLLSRALLAVGAVTKAEEVLVAAHRRHPDDFWLNIQLARTLRWYTRPPRREEAAGYCRAALAIRPDAAGAHMGLVTCLSWPEHADEAMFHLHRAIELQPDFAHPHHTLGLAMAARGEWREAIDCYQNCLRGKPSAYSAASVYHDLIIAYGVVHEWGKVLACCEKLAELNQKHVSAYAALVLAIRNQKDRAATISWFREFVKADPTSALGHYCLGTALWYEGRWKESLAAYERTVELAPEDPDPYYSLGNNQRRLNRPDEAIDSYTTARKLGLRSAGLLYELGLALKEKGRIEEAIDTWREALRIEANLAKAHTALAWCLATAADPRLRDPKAALAHAKKAVELAETSPNHWSNLGVAQLRAGDAKAAVEALERADRMWTGGDNLHRFFLAMAYWQAGDRGAARRTYEQAVRWMGANQPDNEELRRFRAEAETLLKINKS